MPSLGPEHVEAFFRLRDTSAGYFNAQAEFDPVAGLRAMMPDFHDLVTKGGLKQAEVTAIALAAVRSNTVRARELLALKQSINSLSPEDFL